MAVVSQDTKVRAEQIRLLYEAIPASVFSTVFIASILGLILWSSSIPRTNLIVWLALPFAISVARLIFYTQYTKDIDSGSDKVAIYERKFIVGTVLSAMVWGLLPISVYPDNITFQVVIAFALAGMSAGAVTSLSFHLSAIRIFLIVSLVPLIVRFLVSEDFVLQSMGVMVVAYLAMLLISAHRIYINTQQNIVLRLNSDRREHELEKIIAERERLDEMKNDFISTVSHELRTPLTSIRGSLGLLKNDVVGKVPEQAKEVLDIASRNTERLLLLINDILDLQKVESGSLEFRPEIINVREFLVCAIQENEGYANEYEVTFILKDIPPSVSVFADRDRLLQVMNNLLSNAAKFSHRKGVVEVGCEVFDQRVRILVSDHGEGIPRDFHKDVFNKFTQADTSDTKKVRGTGLGLSISKYIVEKHGGFIWFESEESAGSTFYVELPISPKPVK